MIRVLIVDDEPLARRNIRALLTEERDVEIAGECGSGGEALAFLKREAVDLVFLDIQMPGMTGFDVISRLDTVKLPAIIFVTAFNEFAIQAFEVAAVDYLLKPVDRARFGVALDRARKRQGTEFGERLIQLLDTARPAARLVVRSASRTVILHVDEIDYIEADDYYASIHVGADSHLLRTPLQDLEIKLDSARFLRIHRSYIVNMDRVVEIRRTGTGTGRVILRDGATLPVSRSRLETVERRLTG